MKNGRTSKVTKVSPSSRLLFCQTLLDEYEHMHQPALDPTELDDIKATIARFRKNVEENAKLDPYHLAQLESVFGGEMMKRIYQLFNKAQTREAEQTYEGPKAELDKRPADTEAKNTIGEIIADAKNIVTELIASATGESGHGRSQGNAVRKVFEKPLLLKGEKLAACTLRSALCLSGGGVRSATFNLGVLQGLARHGLLDKIDYLSTVSGGGFIGGWLSAWIRRAGMKKVVEELSKPPASPLAPDPAPVEHLRIYSNYLSPQPGLLSADTWTLVASVVRNLLLNWLVFVPVLTAMLLLPRLWSAIVLATRVDGDKVMMYALIIGSLAGFWSLANIGLMLPSANYYSTTLKPPQYKTGEGSYISRCLIAMVVSAAALSVFFWTRYRADARELEWYYYPIWLAVIGGFSWFFCYLKIRSNREKRGKRFHSLILLATLLIVGVIPLAAGLIANSIVVNALPFFHQHPIAYSVLSVPMILLLMSLEGTLIAGFTSRFSKDDDQEWWARAGAWVLIVVITWALVHALVLYGPLLLLTLEAAYNNLKNGGLRGLSWADWGKIFGTVAGIVSGVVTLFGGVSAKTPANSKEATRTRTGGMLLGLATTLVAPLFLGFLIILISLGTDWLLVLASSISDQLGAFPVLGLKRADPTSSLSTWHRNLIEATPAGLVAALFVFLIALGAALGWLISTNFFSLQYLWRNRIIRAYLGASHIDRDPDLFTGFDSYDNLQMHELWPKPGDAEIYSTRQDRPAGDFKFPDGTEAKRGSRKLFHILNMALNLTGGEKLQWQDRKAESFTVSPLHAGSYWLGYRPASCYGGPDGITLGASIAISGAFVSPNMGFMMTSPVVRFLMALFNVRFGWWFGNPGPAGDDTCQLDSPRLSVLPFLKEAIGDIDDKASYVYLSDGGHFENLGLYEMVLRRCRFIVVCDATTDPGYSFESLAMSIRQIRVDLGVPIDIPEMQVGVPSQNLKSKYCAVGRIRYSCVDKPAGEDDEDYDGVLIFIKPSLIGREPRDVINYWQGRESFPQEAITDQWFSEAQFESYRALGSYIIEAICGTPNTTQPLTLADFAQKAQEHNLLNFDAFREQLGLLALEHEFRGEMQRSPNNSYQEKVREFMNRILS